MESPAAVCQSRLLEHHARLSRAQKRELLLAYAKLLDFFAGLTSAVVSLHSPALVYSLLIPLVVFILLAVLQDRVVRYIARCKRIIAFYERALARIENRWSGNGEPGDRWLDSAHPYARDLDLFGEGSLFQLLCAARTRAGEERLARWLVHAAPPDEVLARQAAVADLRERLSFREHLFAAGESIPVGVHPETLAAWGESIPQLRARWLPYFFGALSLGWIVLAVLWLFHTGTENLGGFNGEAAVSGPLWYSFLALSLLNYGVSRVYAGRVHHAAGAIEHAGADLRLIAQVLAVMEAEAFTAPLLIKHRSSLHTGRIPASAAIGRLGRIVDWLEDRHNLVVRIFFAFCFYDALFTLLAEHWQSRFGSSIRAWLIAVGETEALASLAAYAFEHPDDVFPVFTNQEPCFDARALAHPLLPPAQAVANDLTLGNAPQLIVISGPNMAGKSTFLRGVGLNAVLAQCGAPVRARSLRLSPLAVGASICILDSLQGGISRFYAEIQRLKVLSDLAGGALPLLFLLDELLSGTNSHDRYQGTRFIVASLIRKGAIGLVTTHDLALTRIPLAMSDTAANCHFEDSFRDGLLHFDYKLKPGIVQTSNALRLMQAIGLEVDSLIE